MDGWHMLAYAGAALDASAGDVKVNAVPEQLFLINNNNFRMPSNYNLNFAYAGSVGMTRARIVTPYFRIPNFPQIVPVNAALVIPTNMGIMDFRNNPLPLQYSQEVEVDATNAAANTCLAFLGVTKGDLDPTIPPLEWRWARFTSSVTGGTLTWGARAEITFQDTLDQGTYYVAGLHCSGTLLAATRLIFNNQYHRPGSIGFATPDLVPRPIFDRGMGIWGSFQNLTPPGVEVMQTTGSAITLSGLMLIAKASSLA